MRAKPVLETELKLRVPDLAPLTQALAALGFAEALPAQVERSVLWDRDGALRAAGSALRTRSFGGEHRLTWKGPKVPDAHLKIRPERETAVQDPEALEAILLALGYAPTLVMEKTRALWTRKDLEACLDETPFGCFLELEGAPEAIEAARLALGLSLAQTETRSYPELFVAHGLGNRG
jgi:adenylate cyclase class 2